MRLSSSPSLKPSIARNIKVFLCLWGNRVLEQLAKNLSSWPTAESGDQKKETTWGSPGCLGNTAQKLYPTPFPSPEPQSANQKPKQCKLYFTNYHWCDLRPPSWTQVKPFLESKHNTPGISAHPRLCGAQLGDLLLQPHRSLSCWPSQPERITLVHYLCCWFTKYWCYCFACVGFPIAAA